MIRGYFASGSEWRVVALAVAFLLPFMAVTNYTLNHWYVTGAFMLDSGWFSYLASNASFPNMSNPPSIGGSYLETHFSPIFWLLSLASKLFFFVSDPVFFSITQGLWAGLIGFSVFRFAEGFKVSAGFSTALAIASALNGFTLAIIGFPHFELAIPALLLLALNLASMRQVNKVGLACAIVLLLSTREDAGLHAFGLFSVTAFYFGWTRDKEFTVRFAILAGICLAYAIAAMAIQKWLFGNGDNALVRVYAGSPAYSHITFQFLAERLQFYLLERDYIYVPLFIAAGFSLYKRDLLLFLGVSSAIPWLIFSALAISDQAGQLVSYYSFPLMIIVLWPSVAAVLRGSYRNSYLYLQMALCLTSSGLLLDNAGLHDSNPLKRMSFEYLSSYDKTERAVAMLDELSSELGSIVVDDSLASFSAGSVDGRQWRYAGHYSAQEIENIDTVIYYKDTWLMDTFETIRTQASLDNYYTVAGTNILVASRLDLDSIAEQLNLQSINALHFPACQLGTEVGELGADCRLVTPGGVHTKGFLTFGPYQRLSEGHFAFTITYKSSGSVHLEIGAWDVVIAHEGGQLELIERGAIHATDSEQGFISGDFHISSANAGARIEVRFLVDSQEKVEVESLSISSKDSARPAAVMKSSLKHSH